MTDESLDPMGLPLFAGEPGNGQELPGRVRSTFRLDGSPRPKPVNGASRIGRTAPVAVEDLRAAYRRTLEANETGGQPGTQPPAAHGHNDRRVPVDFRVTANDAATQRAAAGPLDWVEVARLRAEASAALTDVLGEQPGISRVEQEEIGRTIIGRLLDAADAAAIADRGQARPLAETRAVADAVFDALCASIGAAIAGDRTLGGLCDWIEAEAPQPVDLPIEGAAALKAAVIPVVLHYSTADPLG